MNAKETVLKKPDEKSDPRTSLYESQKPLGAHFGGSFGWEMAASYGAPVDEHRHVRESAGLIDLSSHGAILVSGKESVQFLNGLVTNDVKTLGAGHGLQAAFLTGHGKVKALCRILGLGDRYLIINDPHTHRKIFDYIFPFSYAGDFKAEDASTRYRIISVQGPGSLSVMKEVCFEPIPDLAEHDWIQTIIAGQQVLVVRATHTGEPGYDIVAPEEGLRDVWDFLLMKGAFHSIRPFGFVALNTLRIEAGIPVYGVDIDESNMMLETGLADAVSYHKGCYTGQEAVAMATYRGHVSKQLSGLIVSGDLVPARGDKIAWPETGKEIGYVTSALASPSLDKIIAMGYVKYGFFEPGTTVEIRLAGSVMPAITTELPFQK
jgi:glycine cleavage system T protein